jgi:hypothetical protein
MNAELEKKLNLFVNNVGAVKEGFPWQEPMAKRLAALVYAIEGRKLDSVAIANCHRMIKKETRMFSSFRGDLSVLIAAMMAMSSDPATRFSDTLAVYNMLKTEKFRSSDYLVASAYEIAAQGKQKGFAQIVQRAREFFLGLRANNRFLIGADDYIYAAMMALTDMDVAEGCERVKNLYAKLREEFPFTTSRSGLLHLAQILMLSDGTENCVSKIVHMNQTLRKHKIRLDSGMMLPSLGILVALSANADELASDINDTMNFLRGQKGFGVFSIEKSELLMQTVALISSSDLAKAAASSVVTNLLIAQQVAIMTVIIASSSAATASSASC